MCCWTFDPASDRCFCGIFKLQTGSILIGAISFVGVAFSILYKVCTSMYSSYGIVTFIYDVYLLAAAGLLIWAILNKRAMWMIPYLVAQVLGMVGIILIVVILVVGEISLHFFIVDVLQKKMIDAEGEMLVRMIIALLIAIFCGLFFVAYYFFRVIQQCYRTLKPESHGYHNI